ncbi:MAG: hypothetical protein GXY05_15895 [Clostridiales bacterium]|nr:hypothetical protein [Clostridiales bacterium]
MKTTEKIAENLKQLIVETPLGQLIAEITSDPLYPGIYVVLRRQDGIEINLSVTECTAVAPDGTGGHALDKNETPEISGYEVSQFTYGDTSNEDWTNKHTWSQNDIWREVWL